MASDPVLIFEFSPEKSPRLAMKNPPSQNSQDRPYFFSDPLFFKPLSEVSNTAPSENGVPKIEKECEEPSKTDVKLSISHDNKSSSGEKLFIRTVGFGDKAVSTSAPITPSIK